MATAPKSVEHKNQCTSSSSSSSACNRQDIMVGNLPDDFLRVDATIAQQQITSDEQVAMAIQQAQYAKVNAQHSNIRGRLDMTVVEAKLVKNYGVTRMDPYVRLRIGHHIFETRTCYNGAKNPKWNKVFHCFVPQGVDSFHVEIYDECSFTNDEMVAWALYKIPDAVWNGDTAEEWVPLSGKQGEGKEGTICLVTSFTPISRVPALPTMSTPMVMNMPNQHAGLVYGNINIANPPQVFVQQPGILPPIQQLPPQVVPQLQPIVISEEDVQIVHEMFPNVEIDVIKAIMETQRGNKDRTINALLTMTSEST